MSYNAWQTYQEMEITSADGLELVEMLYESAIEAVRQAGICVREGDIRGRSNQITRAAEILSELAGSLDFERGGELSRNLSALYIYMQERLVQANTEQREEPLNQVAELLAILLEGWQECRQQTASNALTAQTQTAYSPLACSF